MNSAKTVGDYLRVELDIDLRKSSHPADVMVRDCPLDTEVGRACVKATDAFTAFFAICHDAGTDTFGLEEMLRDTIRIYMVG